MAFRDVAGHRRLLTLLARSIRCDTLPPSLIFAGSPESGTRAAAVAAAQALNCLAPVLGEAAGPPPSAPPAGAPVLGEAAGAPPSAPPAVASAPPAFAIDACGSCTACTKIARGVHPDLLIVEPGDNGSIRIDQVRDVVDRAAYRPFEGKRRVVIVDEADALVPAAQNALLKTLEEPPPSSVFILITSRPAMLLDTVRSRCPQLRFPLAAAASVDEEARAVAARVLAQAAADGSPGGRLAATRDLLAGTGAGGARDREQLASHLRAMASLVRDAELLSAGADATGLANPDVRPAVERLADSYSGERGLQAFAALDRGLEALDRNAGVKIVADWVMLNL